MNTKEAIKFLEKDFKRAENVFRNFCMPLIGNGEQEIAKLTKKHEGIIDLLKHGEKFEQMWKEVKETWGFNRGKRIVEIEQKYFPKG